VCSIRCGTVEQKAAKLNRRVADARPRGWLSPFARVAGWLIILLYAGGICASYALQRRAGLPNEHLVDDVVLRVGFGAFAVVGALLVAKRPANLIGWIMATIGLMVGVFHAGDAYSAYVMVTRGHPDALAIVGAWIGSWYWFLVLTLALIYLPLLFPDGRLPSRRWLPVAVLPGIGLLGIIVLGALADPLPVNEAPVTRSTTRSASRDCHPSRTSPASVR
jgi:hypothetical protein